MTHHCNLCHDTLLRHIRQSRLYWFCPSCRQEMPKADVHGRLPSPDISPGSLGFSAAYTPVTVKALI
jgi:hypothetical protein